VDDLASDVLWGCKAIAKAIGRPLPMTFYLLQNHLIPATKTGDVWVTTRSRLARHFNGETPATTKRRGKRAAS
jgi:hypothetical protein